MSSLCAGEVYIIGTADLHGEVRKLAALAPEFCRYPEAVKVDAGDLIQGSFTAVELRGAPLIAALNHLQYDVWVPGNHEFEFAPEDFCRWQKDFRGVILGAQWKFGSSSPARFTVVTRGGYRIGIIGLGASQMAAKTRWRPGLNWQDEEKVLRETLDALSKKKCHAVILVCHIAIQGSYGEIYRLLQKFPEIDAVISSHSHREHYGEIISGRLAAQPGARGSSAVVLTLHFGAQKHLEYVSSSLLRPGGRVDAGVMKIAVNAERAVRNKGMKEYGYFADAASFGRTAAEMLRLGSQAEAAVVCFNGKYFRRRINGWNLYRIFPFGNRLVMAEVDLTALRRFAAAQDAPPRHCFLSVAPEVRGKRVKVVMSDFLYAKFAGAKDTGEVVLPFFERETVAGELEKLRSGTIL